MKFALKEVVNVNSLSELPAFNEVGLEALIRSLTRQVAFNEVISLQTERETSKGAHSMMTEVSLHPQGFVKHTLNMLMPGGVRLV